MVTLQDVADSIGVSHSTVSRVLNGNQRISAATRKRVLEAVTQLKYRPQKKHAVREPGVRQVEVIFFGMNLDEGGAPVAEFYFNVMRAMQRMLELLERPRGESLPEKIVLPVRISTDEG